MPKYKTRRIIALALGWFALLTSHNLMVLALGVPFAVWCVIWIYKFKAWKKIPILAVSGGWALGLAAFFTLPAVLENKFTHIDSVLIGYYDYTAHFATINQTLFSRFWGYGPSVWLEYDGMSFQAGHMHWILSLVMGLVILIRYWKTKKFDNLSLLIVFFLIVGWFAAFLTHVRSTPIWLLFSPLRYLQFPWRLLSIVILSFSFLIGAIPVFLKNNLSKIVTCLLIVGVVAFNWTYFKPEHGKLGPLTDEQKFTKAAWELQQTAGIYDYLPKTAVEAPKGPQKFIVENPKDDKGTFSVIEASQGTDWAKFKVNVETETAIARVGIMKFPGWTAYIDGKATETYIPEDERWGRMWMNIPQGEHTVELKFENTPIRTIGNYLSLISWVGLITAPLWSKKVKI